MQAFVLGWGSWATAWRVSTADCQIGLPAVKESLITGLSTCRLPKYIGWGRAKKMILGGEIITGEEALGVGLVDRIVPAENFQRQLGAVARDYLEACSTGARMSKLMLGLAFEADYDSVLKAYFTLQKNAQYSPDALEAGQAYLSGRKPEWQ